MNLVIVSYGMAEVRDGQYYVNQKWGQFINELRECVDSLEVVMEKAPEKFRQYTYHLDPEVRVHLVGEFTSGIVGKLQQLMRKRSVLKRVIRDADLVMIFAPQMTAGIAAALARQYQKPYFVYVGSDWIEVAPFMVGSEHWVKKLLVPVYRWMGQRMEKQLVRCACFVLVHGRYVYDRLKQWNDRVFETVPMIELREEDFFIREDTCQDNPVRVLFVGVLAPRKGVEYLLYAADQVRKRIPEVEFVIVGKGTEEYEQYLRDIVRELHLEDVVQFVGYIESFQRLLEYYRSADIFVLPSLGEGFPRVIYEAQSQGLPVIASNIATLRSQLQDGENAVLFSPGNSRALADAIIQLVMNEELRKNLIRKGYQSVQGRVGKRTTSQQVIDLIAQNRCVQMTQR